MGKATKLLSALIKEYGDDAVRIARGVLGMDAEPAAVEQAVKRIAQRKPAARTTAARPQPESLAVRRVPALPAPKGVKHPVREGYSVDAIPVRGVRLGKDRIEYNVRGPEGALLRSPAIDEGGAWAWAYRAANPDLGKYKPRGGQWVPDDIEITRKFGMLSPEALARQTLRDRTGDAYAPDAEPDIAALRDWWERAVPKYLKNDLGTETDPLLDLADRGLLHQPDTTRDQWRRYASGAVMQNPIGWYTLPPHANDGDIHFGPTADMRETLLSKAPWLAKQPMTDDLYGFSADGVDRNLELGHVVDELVNALRPSQSGLPSDLAIRPESFQRMSFPQAVERVGQINQWRAKRMEEEQLAAMMNNPAIHTYKEYPEAGMRWVELRQPVEGGEAPEGWEDIGSGVWRNPNATGAEGDLRYSTLHPNTKHLQDALRMEGDAMGHCVGGYCDDVVSGRSRIFSLRDAKGNPHVTIEAAPGSLRLSEEDAIRLQAQAMEELGLDPNVVNTPEWPEIDKAHGADISARYAALVRARPAIEDIVQIKGKQNRAPVDEYLPYVQDFVKSGTWGNIGDFGNTGLVKLPDGRYITQQQLDEIARSEAAVGFMGSPENAQRNLAAWNLKTYSPEDWDQTKHLFEGFAVGGRVDASRCFSRNPLSVR